LVTISQSTGPESEKIQQTILLRTVVARSWERLGGMDCLKMVSYESEAASEAAASKQAPVPELCSRMTGIRGRRGVRGINRQRTLERRNDEQTGLRQQPKGVRGLLPQGVHLFLPDGRLGSAQTTFASHPGKRSLHPTVQRKLIRSQSDGSSSGSRLSCWGEASVLSDQPDLPFL
jgi:hypothetical protein